MTGIEALKLEQEIEEARGRFYTYSLIRGDLLCGPATEYPYLFHALRDAAPGDHILGCNTAAQAARGDGLLIWTWEK